MDFAGAAGQFDQCHHAHYAAVCYPDGDRLGSYSSLCRATLTHVSCPRDTFCKSFVGFYVSLSLSQGSMYLTNSDCVFSFLPRQHFDLYRRRSRLKR